MISGIIVSKGNHPQMALIQVSELLQFTQMILPRVRVKAACVCQLTFRSWNRRQEDLLRSMPVACRKSSTGVPCIRRPQISFMTDVQLFFHQVNLEYVCNIL